MLQLCVYYISLVFSKHCCM